MTPTEDAAVARTLQRGLLPTRLPDVPGLAVSARYRAGGTGDVGGDWYDVLDLPGDSIAFVIGDVAGRGVTAAITMAQLRFAVRAYLFIDDGPGAVLARLNRLSAWLLPGEVATALIAIFRRGSDDVRISSAGHPPPLLTSSQRTEYVALTGSPALGINTAADFPETLTGVTAGDALVLYTDGLIERRGEPIDDGLARLLRTCRDHDAGDGDLLDHLVAAVPDATADDDLAAVSVCRTEDT